MGRRFASFRRCVESIKKQGTPQLSSSPYLFGEACRTTLLSSPASFELMHEWEFSFSALDSDMEVAKQHIMEHSTLNTVFFLRGTCRPRQSVSAQILELGSTKLGGLGWFQWIWTPGSHSPNYGLPVSLNQFCDAPNVGFLTIWHLKAECLVTPTLTASAPPPHLGVLVADDARRFGTFVHPVHPVLHPV